MDESDVHQSAGGYIPLFFRVRFFPLYIVPFFVHSNVAEISLLQFSRRYQTLDWDFEACIQLCSCYVMY